MGAKFWGGTKNDPARGGGGGGLFSLKKTGATAGVMSHMINAYNRT